MSHFLVLGAGVQAAAIVADLSTDHQVTVVDQDASALKTFMDKPGVEIVEGSAADHVHMAPLMEEADVTISAVPYFFNPGLTELAIKNESHFLDLGGNSRIVDAQLELAQGASVTVVPDCGLAPGMGNVLAALMIARHDALDTLEIRVGGLPERPEGPLKYQRLFSIHGLINEYNEPCRVLAGGRLGEEEPLTGIEMTFFPGFGLLEAFHTSGGISTLTTTMAGKVQNLNYKTLRYPGHCAQMITLRRLGLFEGAEGDLASPRAWLTAYLERTLPHVGPDVSLVGIRGESATGEGFGYRMVIRPQRKLSAMAVGTGFPTAVIARAVAAGQAAAGGQPPELAVDPEWFISQMSDRGVQLLSN